MESKRSSQNRLVFLQRGAQKKFILQAKEALGVDWSQLAEQIDAHPRCVRDWAREKYNMAHRSALILARKSKINIPKEVQVKVWKEHLKKAGHIGGSSVVKKYGRVSQDEEHRQKQWLEWWHKKGQHSLNKIKNDPLPFHKPKRSKELAEFVGIMLGDGGVSKYQLTVTLHRHDDYQYSLFVRKIIKKLFHIEAGKSMLKNALADNIVISRIKMVEYAVKDLGLVIGNKVRQQVDIVCV